MNRAGKEGWNIQSLIADFHFLLYISTISLFDIKEDIPSFCESALNKDIPLNEGYILMLRSIAGMD